MFPHTLNGVTPPPRATAWTTVLLEESATENGTYTQIDSQSIPVDPTPLEPDPIDVSTSLATLESCWLRVRFADGVTMSAYSDSVHSPDDADDVSGLVPDLDLILDRGGRASDYPYERKVAALQVALDAFEQEANCAFGTRTRTDVLSGAGGRQMVLARPYTREILEFTVDGATADVSGIAVDASGVLYRADRWPYGHGNISLTYTHGLTPIPGDVRRALALLASSYLADGPWDDRGYGVTEGGGGLVRLLTAGVSGAAFSIPEVQAALQRHRFAVVL